MCKFDDNDDDWPNKAMEDSSLVANLLLRIKNQTSSPSPPLNLSWTVRQRRSRTNRADKKTEPARASPTTPLSWSAATTASGPPAAAAVASGSEESSRPTKSLHTSRSDHKADEQNETATANKRSRKKRSLPELLEEEKLLLKERSTLKDKLASMHETVDRQRAKNESLKRMKLDLVSRQTSKTATISLASGKGKAIIDTLQLVETPSTSSKLPSPPQPIQEKVRTEEALVANASSRQQEAIGKKEPKFLLPDLNLPAEEEDPDIS